MIVTPEEIYEAYPRSDKRRYSIRHISKAVKRLKEQCPAWADGGGFAETWLKCRVIMYAESRAGKDKRFTPHCSTWMNQERYHDDTADWFDGQSEDDRKNRADLGESETVVQTD